MVQFTTPYLNFMRHITSSRTYGIQLLLRFGQMILIFNESDSSLLLAWCLRLFTRLDLAALLVAQGTSMSESSLLRVLER